MARVQSILQFYATRLETVGEDGGPGQAAGALEGWSSKSPASERNAGFSAVLQPVNGPRSWKWLRF